MRLLNGSAAQLALVKERKNVSICLRSREPALLPASLHWINFLLSALSTWRRKVRCWLFFCTVHRQAEDCACVQVEASMWWLTCTWLVNLLEQSFVKDLLDKKIKAKLGFSFAGSLLKLDFFFFVSLLLMIVQVEVSQTVKSNHAARI